MRSSVSADPRVASAATRWAGRCRFDGEGGVIDYDGKVAWVSVGGARF
jgi:hypothetical protein